MLEPFRGGAWRQGTFVMSDRGLDTLRTSFSNTVQSAIGAVAD